MKKLMINISSLMIRIKELEKNNEINPSQTHIIEMIGSYPETTANEITEHLNVTKGLVSQLIKELVDEGYVIQQTDKKDRRVKRLSLTDDGLRIYRYHAECHNVLIDILEDNLTPDEQEIFMKGLDLLNQALKDYEK